MLCYTPKAQHSNHRVLNIRSFASTGTPQSLVLSFPSVLGIKSTSLVTSAMIPRHHTTYSPSNLQVHSLTLAAQGLAAPKAGTSVAGPNPASNPGPSPIGATIGAIATASLAVSSPRPVSRGLAQRPRIGTGKHLVQRGGFPQGLDVPRLPHSLDHNKNLSHSLLPPLMHSRNLASMYQPQRPPPPFCDLGANHLDAVLHGLLELVGEV